MLTLTENAATIVKTISDRTTSGETGGLRFSSADGSDALAIATADAPEPGDSVVERDGARVFLAEAAADVLDDQVLDAEVDPSGGIQFTIVPQ